MKKILSIVLTIVILLSLFTVTASANSNAEIIVSQTTEYFEDGSCVTTTITKQVSAIMPLGSTYNLTGSKTKTVKNADGDVLFKFKITATFSVNEGVSATCTAVSCSASDLASGWSLYTSGTTKSGNKATATGVFKHKILGITDTTKEVTNTLTCSATGELS